MTKLKKVSMNTIQPCSDQLLVRRVTVDTKILQNKGKYVLNNTVKFKQYRHSKISLY